MGENKMYKLCKSEHSARRQRELELKLLDLMGRMPYQNISVSSICESAGVPRRAFYRYFEHKDDALDALIDHMLLQSEFAGEKKNKTKRTVFLELERLYAFWQRNAELLDVLTKNGMSMRLIDRSVEYAINVVVPMDKLFSRAADGYSKFAIRFMISGLTYSVLTWYKGGFRESVSEMAKMAKTILEYPILPSTNSIFE